jgi:glyoxylase-like metal-dependent hydrolase (beta-lactamase superfamily II)
MERIIGLLTNLRVLGIILSTLVWQARFPLATISTWDKQEARASAQKLLALDPTVLVVGHGPAITAPAGAMDRAIERARS